MPIDPAKIQFERFPKREFRFEAFYEKGVKKWQASAQFDISIHIDNSDMSLLELASIEYRQYIRGGVWTRRGNKDWSPDNAPDGNASFKIPRYAGQTLVHELPMPSVDGEVLDMFKWKEDGEIETGGTEKYGYRDTAMVNKPNEIDEWRPWGPSGTSYSLRDTPSIRGDWGSGDSVEVWIELYFKGFVVEVDRPDMETRPIRVLKHKEWKYFWPDQKLDLWGNAERLADVP